MTKQRIFTLAMSGAALVLASHAQAQFTYSSGDVLLNFRTYSVPASTVGSTDVEIDLGSAANLVANTASLPSSGTIGGIAVSTLDLTGGGTQGTYTPLFTSTALYSALYGGSGTPSTTEPIGFSASGGLGSGPNGADELFLTRALSAGNLTVNGTGLTASAQQSAAVQASTLSKIGLVGTDAAANGTLLTGSSSQAIFVSSSDADSYQKQAQQTSSPIALEDTINWGATQNSAAGAGGALESKFTGGADVYEALWDVPNSDSSGASATELGYFTFQTDGEIDFTTATSAVPEPSAYELLGMTGAMALAFRRKLRSLVS